MRALAFAHLMWPDFACWVLRPHENSRGLCVFALVQIASSVSASVGVGAASSASVSSGGGGGGGGAGGPGFFGCIQAVQFAAATSDMCGVQSQTVLVDILDVMQSLNVFNLRFPLPDLSQYLPASPELVMTISFCGMSSDVDLAAQARGEAGENFMANVLVGSLVLVSVSTLHFLILLGMPRRLLPKIAGSFPFVQTELVLFVVGNQWLLISSTQLIGLGIESNEQTCVAAGVVVLMIPTAFLLFVLALLWLFVRPSSKFRRVRWTEDDGWSVSDANNEEDGSAAASGNHPKRGLKPRLPGASSGAAVADGEEGEEAPQSALARACERLVESLQNNFVEKFEPLLEGYHNRRFSWVGAWLMLLTEYCLALAIGLGVTSSCTAEQVPNLGDNCTLPGPGTPCACLLH